MSIWTFACSPLKNSAIIGEIQRAEDRSNAQEIAAIGSDRFRSPTHELVTNFVDARSRVAYC
jgi:hypothetical protein